MSRTIINSSSFPWTALSQEIQEHSNARIPLPLRHQTLRKHTDQRGNLTGTLDDVRLPPPSPTCDVLFTTVPRHRPQTPQPPRSEPMVASAPSCPRSAWPVWGWWPSAHLPGLRPLYERILATDDAPPPPATTTSSPSDLPLSLPLASQRQPAPPWIAGQPTLDSSLVPAADQV